MNTEQPIIARMNGGEVEVGGLLEDLHRETTRLAQIVQAQLHLLVYLLVSLDRRERTIAGLEAWITDAREALSSGPRRSSAPMRSHLPPAGGSRSRS